MSDPYSISAIASQEGILTSGSKEAVEAALPAYIQGRRWFRAKARVVRSVEIVETVPFSYASAQARVAMARVNFSEGAPQTYVLPLAYASGEKAAMLERVPLGRAPQAVVTRLEGGIVYDATWDSAFNGALLAAIRDDARFKGQSGELVASTTQAFEPLLRSAQGQLEPSVMRAEQSNTSVVYGRTFILKLFRLLEEGASPDLEVGRFLADKGFRNSPPTAGALEYLRGDGEPVTLAILQGFVPNQGDAWEYTLSALDDYFDEALRQGDIPDEAIPQGSLLDLTDRVVPEQVRGALGSYLDSARLLGRRTAELHVTLASDTDDPAFAPEPFTMEYQRALYDSMRGLTEQSLRTLATRLDRLPEKAVPEARSIVERQGEILSHFHALLDREIAARRTRCHGDYHLGQVLYTGSDFMLIDFEGEPVRSLAERRQKHSPLKDVAGMLRSFHYGAYAALFQELDQEGRQERARELETWASAWHLWVGAAFLKEYLQVAQAAGFLPDNREQLQSLLDIYVLEKAVYELVYELNNRPDWVSIPLQGIRQLLA